MLIRCILLVSVLLTQIPARSQSPTPYSQRMADAFLTWHPDSILIGSRKTARWDYEQGLMLKALERVWQHTGEAKYFIYSSTPSTSSCGPTPAYAPTKPKIIIWIT